MREVTKYGKSISEAVNIALKELNAKPEQVDIHILETPRFGFLGIGARKALVKVTLKKTPFDYGIDYLTNLVNKSGLTARVQVEERCSRLCRCSLVGKDAAKLIGKHGKTLNALQFLANRVISLNGKHQLQLILDCENYRAVRREALITLAGRIADKVMMDGRPYRLEPMPAFERKILHSVLAGNNKIRTFSTGEEPRRCITVAPQI
ncbi:protein jag [Sporolactobacillus sp. CPB3-1]|uniref:RNA-binding protein KhpB n=1 Tax=Sporolactobacillus mangiferae TaxID=2940498 RepID=A0ABT0MBG5_9BACL|nr:protein jag [Sporolactobacillus mangiferae]